MWAVKKRYYPKYLPILDQRDCHNPTRKIEGDKARCDKTTSIINRRCQGASLERKILESDTLSRTW